MKRYFYVSMIAVLAVAVFGCSTNRTKIGEGAAIGGVLGATAGGIVGHQSGHGVEGALIGGALGATGGAATGAQVEK